MSKEYSLGGLQLRREPPEALNLVDVMLNRLQKTKELKYIPPENERT